LELFKKTLPAPSLVQLAEREASVRSKALKILKGLHSSTNPQMNFIEMALEGKAAGFEKVIKMIDEMVATLKKEQADDDSKKEYCGAELDKSEDKKKELERAVSVSETAIEDLEGTISTLTTEVSSLLSGIKALDKAVAEATEMRKEEAAEYQELMQSNKAAKEILAWAKNRLNKFYQPKMYKEEMPAPASFVQVRLHKQGSKDAPPPPPEFSNYAKKTAQSTGVIAMIDVIIGDIDKEMTASKTEEEDAQQDYEAMMAKAADKRAQDSKSVTEKNSAKAATEEALQAEKDKKKGNEKELMMTSKTIVNLHGECDWLIKYYDVRRSARNDEIDALGKAKAVLNGADFSFVQLH
jgi:chromosome segregation ATPase